MSENIGELIALMRRQSEDVWHIPGHQDCARTLADFANRVETATNADQADGEDYEQPQRTLDIIARMLGWMNTPPRRVFEQEINALKRQSAAGKLIQATANDALDGLRLVEGPDEDVKYNESLIVKLRAAVAMYRA